jgi:hypothetical protein
MRYENFAFTATVAVCNFRAMFDQLVIQPYCPSK